MDLQECLNAYIEITFCFVGHHHLTQNEWPSSANTNAGCSVTFAFQINNEWFLVWECMLYIQMQALFFGNSNSQGCPVFQSGNPLQDLSNSARHKTAFPASWVLSTHFSSTSPSLSPCLWAHVGLSVGSCLLHRWREWVRHFHRVRTCGEWLGAAAWEAGTQLWRKKP